MNLPAFTSTSSLQPPNATLPLPPPPHAPSHLETRPSNRNPNQVSIPNPINQQFDNSKKSENNTVSWTSSITRLCRNGQLSQAAHQLNQMRLSGIEPNHITFIALLSGCADFALKSRDFGPQIHGYVRKLGLDKYNVMVGTAIVDMYAKCGQVELARVAFDDIEVKNSFSWNTIIDGYMRNGDVDNAVKLFDEMPDRDVVSWTVFIDGFVKKGLFGEALEWFREMQISQIEPDYVTVIAILSACGNLGALGLGLWVNKYILKKDFKDNVRVSNALIDMYSRCGCVELARQVFEKMVKRTSVSWNSIIVGCAANGFAIEALEYFDLMQKEGFKPDGVSFTGALTACSHAGLVDEGLQYFEIMKRVHGISPRIEHYGCIVDLYSRAGKLEDAWNVIERMTMKPNEVVLGSLLAACRTHGAVELAEKLMKYLVDFNPGFDSNYVLLANIYADAGYWDSANRVRRRMKNLGIQKMPGYSSIEIGCNVHEFVAGDKTHSETQNIYEMLDLLSHDLKNVRCCQPSSNSIMS